MKTKFRIHSGLAGDLQELLIATNGRGNQEEILINRTGWFLHYRMCLAKKRLLRRLELKTGEKHTEE